MAKFNTAAARPRTSSPIVTEATPTGRTHQGGAGHARDAKSELFLLAVANMVGENTFYENAGQRDTRYRTLVHQLAVEDPSWLASMLRWLRTEANLRSAALVGAAEMVHARLAATMPGGNRSVVDAVLHRADEPGELLAYWTSNYGRAIPKPVKRGVADALVRLLNEYTFAKYDTPSRGYRIGDVIDLVHPTPRAPWQSALFAHALDRRHNRNSIIIPATLPMLQARSLLMALPVEERRGVLLAPDGPERLQAAGITWEALAGWLQGPMDAAAWTAVLPSLGYMSGIRNLRNLDEAGVPDHVVAPLIAKIADPQAVARSRQLPFRFLSAHRAAPSLRWGHALEQALNHSLTNIPRLAGRTLILVDTSSSMQAAFSKDGTLMRWDAAALFGIALGARCENADVVSFSSVARFWGDTRGARTKPFPLTSGESLLRAVERWRTGGWFLGGGTETAAALRDTFRSHDRVVIVTDEQADHDQHEVTASIPASVPMYTWNLAGYQRGHAPSGGNNRHTFGGLTDQAFRMIPLLEVGRNAAWPWRQQTDDTAVAA